MEKNAKYQLSLERRQVLTLALRGALEILQMPQMELGEWLMDQTEKNPLLEAKRKSPPPRLLFEVAKEPSFYEQILLQIREQLLDPKDRKIAKAFFEHMDEKGFLLPSHKAVFDHFGKAAERILQHLQVLDPPGVFARSIQESFLLQLEKLGKKESIAYQIIKDHYEDFLHSRYQLLEKKLGVKDLKEPIRQLSLLSTRPSSVFEKSFQQAIKIDLSFRNTEKGWLLELLDEEIPRMRIFKDYLKAPCEQKEEKESLKEFKAHANWILRALKRRKKILREIGKIVLKRQRRFLEGGKALSPLTMKELADMLNVHESTLSRALYGKYVATPRGVFPLKALIAKTPDTLLVKEAIEELVKKEPKESPFTDTSLSERLREKGFLISRRTVAKYRGQLKIGSARQRKHRKR